MQRLKKTGYFEKCPRKEKKKKTNLRPFHSGWNEISTSVEPRWEGEFRKNIVKTQPNLNTRLGLTI